MISRTVSIPVVTVLVFVLTLSSLMTGVTAGISPTYQVIPNETDYSDHTTSQPIEEAENRSTDTSIADLDAVSDARAYPQFGKDPAELPLIEINNATRVSNTDDITIFQWYRIVVDQPSTYLLNITNDGDYFSSVSLYTHQWSTYSIDTIDHKWENTTSYFLGQLNGTYYLSFQVRPDQTSSLLLHEYGDVYPEFSTENTTPVQLNTSTQLTDTSTLYEINLSGQSGIYMQYLASNRIGLYQEPILTSYGRSLDLPEKITYSESGGLIQEVNYQYWIEELNETYYINPNLVGEGITLKFPDVNKLDTNITIGTTYSADIQGQQYEFALDLWHQFMGDNVSTTVSIQISNYMPNTFTAPTRLDDFIGLFYRISTEVLLLDYLSIGISNFIQPTQFCYHNSTIDTIGRASLLSDMYIIDTYSDAGMTEISYFTDLDINRLVFANTTSIVHDSIHISKNVIYSISLIGGRSLSDLSIKYDINQTSYAWQIKQMYPNSELSLDQNDILRVNISSQINSINLASFDYLELFKYVTIITNGYTGINQELQDKREVLKLFFAPLRVNIRGQDYHLFNLGVEEQVGLKIPNSGSLVLSSVNSTHYLEDYVSEYSVPANAVFQRSDGLLVSRIVHDGFLVNITRYHGVDDVTHPGITSISSSLSPSGKNSEEFSSENPPLPSPSLIVIFTIMLIPVLRRQYCKHR